jgi:putative phage-type endonuclease
MDACGIRTWLLYLRDWLEEPSTLKELHAWSQDAYTLATEMLEEIDLPYASLIIALYEDQMKRQRLNATHTVEPTTSAVPSVPPPPPPPPPPQEILDALLTREQTAQRTEAWYEQAKRIVTASEVYKLFGPPRERAKMVMSKVQPHESFFQAAACTSDELTAFSWGSRFEPVVRQIYEDRYGAEVRDLGRLIHPTDPRTSASPDGLVVSATKEPERKGRLIEIKAPVTRVIQEGVVPKEYYAQMQLQLHVAGLEACDYIECTFYSAYGTRPMMEGPGLYSGIIAVVEREQLVNGQPMYYVYSPLHVVQGEWEPQLERETDRVVEYVSWRLVQIHEKTVVRSEEWWQALQPLLDAFWADVELAKQGQFVVPESTRPVKKRAVEEFSIVFHRLDENGVMMLPPPTAEEVSAIVL